MSKLLVLSQRVHDIIHDLPIKNNYSGSYIYTGNIDIKAWSKLSKSTQKEGLTLMLKILF